MKRNEANKDKFYQDGPYRGLPKGNNSETWLADFFIEKMKKDESGVRTHQAVVDAYAPELSLVESYLQEIYFKCGSNDELYDEACLALINGTDSEFVEKYGIEISCETYAALLRESNEFYQYIYDETKNKNTYRPSMQVQDKDKKDLHKALDRYLHAMYEVGPQFTEGRGGDAQYLLFWLFKNITNSDVFDLVGYVNRYADFVCDETFLNLNAEQGVPLGIVSREVVEGTGKKKETTTYTAHFYAKDMDEYEPGYETPYLMLFWASPVGSKIPSTEKVIMPFIRYGVEHGDTAYVYAIQRRTQQKNDLEKAVTKICAGSRASVNDFRDVTPSMLCVMASFLGMLNAKGIKKLKVPDLLLHRWGEFWNSDTDEQDTKIQEAATDKFLSVFARLDMQFNGVDIDYYPNEIDSFMHLKLDDEIFSNNDILQKFFVMGKSAALTKSEFGSRKEIREKFDHGNKFGE